MGLLHLQHGRRQLSQRFGDAFLQAEDHSERRQQRDKPANQCLLDRAPQPRRQFRQRGDEAERPDVAASLDNGHHDFERAARQQTGERNLRRRGLDRQVRRKPAGGPEVGEALPFERADLDKVHPRQTSGGSDRRIDARSIANGDGRRTGRRQHLGGRKQRFALLVGEASRFALRGQTGDKNLRQDNRGGDQD